jgi:homopolymeric O-antigen transport system permease protein
VIVRPAKIAARSRAETQPPGHATVTVIDAGTAPAIGTYSTVWRYREMIYFLARRDVAVRYKQSLIGIAWVVLQPLILAVVFSVFLGVLAKVPSDYGVPYPVYAVAGLVMWLFFGLALGRASDSTVGSAGLISKVWFPRIIIPVAAVIPPALDFLIALIVVLAAMLVYGVTPAPQFVLVPLLAPLVMALALGFGLFLAPLNVRYRDIGVAIPFVIQIGLFVTPIIYPFSLVPTDLQPFYALNPMVGVLELYRWLLFPSAAFPGWIALIPVMMATILVLTGTRYFQRVERGFADVI